MREQFAFLRQDLRWFAEKQLLQIGEPLLLRQ
jgi:hypothetical protein